MNLIIPVSFMIDNKTFLTKQFHEKDIRRVGLEWADKGTLSFLSADQFRNLIQSGKIRPGKRSAQSSGFRFNQGEVNTEETVPVEMPNLTEAEKLIQTAQIALGSAGVISEKQTPERKAQLAKRIADLKLAKIKCSLIQTNFDLAHWQEIDADEKADKLNTFDTRGKIVKEAALREGKDYFAVEGTVDGQAAGAQTAPTSQEAEHYAEAMLAYLKKQSPKAKKITVHIFKVVNYQRKDTPLKVLKAESTETEGDTIAEGKAVKIGRLTFESFTNGSISGWWVKHITVVQGQGVWKTNTLGWIEERKSSKTSVIPSFLWLEKGNGEENIKALIIWPKGSAPVAGANIVTASNPGTGGLLQAVAKWIQERRPDLVKEETLEPELTEAEKLMDAAQIALGRAGVVSEEKQAPRITEKMIRDDMGLGSQDIGKGAMQILRSGWCANCDKEWYAVVFLAKNRVWWAEINGLDRHATYTNMGKRNLHNAALAKFDAPGKWKDDAGRKYVPVTDSVLNLKKKIRPDTHPSHHLTTEGADQATPITEKMIRDDLGYARIQFMRAGWCADCDKAWYAAVFIANSKKTYWAEISAGDKHPTYSDFGKMGSKALEKFDRPGKWRNTVPALKSPFKS